MSSKVNQTNLLKKKEILIHADSSEPLLVNK